MTMITVFGGSGYAGGHIVEAAVVRGFDVTSVTRSEAPDQMANVNYRTGSLLNAEDRARALAESDVIVVAVAARGDMLGAVRPAVAELANEAAVAGVRVGVIGGAGSLLTHEGGPRLIDTPAFNEDYKPEAQEMADVLDDLREAPEALDWFYVSPAGEFGPWVAGEFLGEYRVSDEVLLTDADGKSAIGGADFGVALIDEIEAPTHKRARFTVAY